MNQSVSSENTSYFNSWMCLMWAVCLSLTPTIGFFYYPIFKVVGFYFNTAVFAIILAASAIIQARLNPKFDLAPLLFSLLMCLSFLVMLAKDPSEVSSEILSSSRIIIYVLIFIILSCSRISLDFYLKIRKTFSVMILFYCFISVGLIVAYGLEGYLELNRDMVTILGRDADVYYGGTTLNSSDGEFFRPTFPGINSNAAVILLIYAFIYFSYRAAYDFSSLNFIFASLLFVFIAATLSRQGILFTGICSLVIYRKLFKVNKKNALVVLITGSALITSIISLYPIVLWRTLQPIFSLVGVEYDNVPSTSNRFGTIERSLNLIFDEPLGRGVYGYSEILGTGVSSEHNLLLYLSITMGLFFTISLMAILFLVIFRVYSKKFGVSSHLARSVIRLDLLLLSLSSIFAPNYVFFLLFLGLLLSVSRS
jgi:hypothetical protein